MSYKNKISQDFSLAAQEYDLHAMLQRKVFEALYAKSLPYLQGAILDIGAGTGWLAKKRDKVISLDISYGMCQQSLQYGASINADMDFLPFADNSIDNIFSSLALQWSQNLKLTIDEFIRVLKPGGYMAISTIGENSLIDLGIETLLHQFPKFEELNHSNILVEKTIITEEYDNLIGLLKNIRKIGAGFKGERKSSIEIIKKINKIDGINANWEIYYSIFIKR